MKTATWMLAGLLAGLLLSTVRRMDRRELHIDEEAGDDRGGVGPGVSEEPILGYDGMDQETILEWVEEAGLDEESVERILEYEEATRRRQPVLDALHDLLA